MAGAGLILLLLALAAAVTAIRYVLALISHFKGVCALPTRAKYITLLPVVGIAGILLTFFMEKPGALSFLMLSIPLFAVLAMLLHKDFVPYPDLWKKLVRPTITGLIIAAILGAIAAGIQIPTDYK